MMDHFTKHKKQAFIFLLPQLLVTVVFFIWPSFNAIVQSLYFSDAFGLHHRFSGVQNYIDLLTDPGFMKALMVSGITGLVVTVLTISAGLLLAYLVNARHKSQIWYKSLLLCPYAVAPAVAAILWRFLCQPTLGWLTYLFHQFGFEFNYLTNVKQAFLVVVLTASWQQFSYNFLFYFYAFDRSVYLRWRVSVAAILANYISVVISYYFFLICYEHDLCVF